MFLRNLDLLMKERKINKRMLSKKSGIPYTTIDGWYKKGWSNISLATLKKLSSYFQISIDTLVCNDGFDEYKLTLSEKQFLDKYRLVDSRGIETLSLLLEAEYQRSTCAKAVKDYEDAPEKAILLVAENSDD